MILEYSLTPAQSRAAALAVALLPLAVLALILVHFLLPRAEHHTRVAELMRQRDEYRAILRNAPAWSAEVEQLRGPASRAPAFYRSAQMSAASGQMEAAVTAIINKDQGAIQHNEVEMHDGGADAPQQLRDTVSLTADISALTRILYDMRAARPLLFVASMTVRSDAVFAGPLSAPNRLHVDFVVVAYLQSR